MPDITMRTPRLHLSNLDGSTDGDALVDDDIEMRIRIGRTLTTQV